MKSAVHQALAGVSKSELAELAALDDIAKDFNDPSALHPWLRPYFHQGREMTALQHPLVYQVFGVMPHQANAFFEHKRVELWKARKARDWNLYFKLHERPYRLWAMRKAWNRRWITLAELREHLPHFWTDTEIPQGQQDDPIELFREAGFVTDNPVRFRKLRSEITLYRGVDGVCEFYAEGPSWTLSKRVARFFANRYDVGAVYSIRVNKHDALAFFTQRGEAEIILDPEELDSSQISCIEGLDKFRQA